jgi:subtilase family serine protease
MRSAPLPRLLFTAAAYVIGLAGLGVPAASAAVQNRITATISEIDQTEIPDSVHPRTRLAVDRGPVPAATRLQGMTIRFSMTAAQQAALDQLLVDLQNPSSPRYHQWLSPAQYGAQFGLSGPDIAKVTAWLTGQGFTVTGVANSGTFVTFDGTAAQAESAFATSIHSLSLNGDIHFANVTSASVPHALAGVVGGITGLHDFRLKPRSRASVVQPQYTSSVSGNHYLAPGDIYTIYDMNPLLSASIDGTGQTIAVTGQVDINLTDVAAFRAASGLSVNAPTVVIEGADPGSAGTCNSCPSGSDLAEASIDVEWAGAMAPAAKLLFVTGKDILFNSVTQAIDQNLAPIVTLSYGNCEAAWGSTDLNTLNQLFKQGNAQGQTILAASADVGATDCDAGTSAIEGLAVDFPASSPYVTGMGGTMFNEGTGTFFGTTNGATGGSATGYIPETVWNEDATGSSFSASGGGPSAFFTKPAWQKETGPPGMTTLVAEDGSRDVPDLSLDASSGHDQFLYCAQGSCSNGYRDAAGNLTVAGGTSFDSQIFGGMLALIEQKIGSRIGNANPTIYALANQTAYYNNTGTSAFHDITTGNNSNPCTAGTPNCPNGGSLGFNAGVGYDLATGWGTVDLNNLASDWNLVTPLGAGSLGPTPSSTALTASSTSVNAGASVTLTATVTGSTGTPTGTLQFLLNNATLSSPVPLAGGIATYTYVTSCFTLGQKVFSASYSGDATYAGSKGPALASAEAGLTGGAGITANGSAITSPLVVTVTSGSCPDFTITPTTPTVSVGVGGTIPPVTITLTPVNNFTGTVVFTATSTTTTSFIPGLSFSPGSITISSPAAATTTLTLSGITANLQFPSTPGRMQPGTMLAGQSPVRTPRTGRTWYAAGSGVTIASLLLLTLPRRRRLGGLLLVALSVAVIGGATGCASSQVGPPATIANMYAGTYSVTVIATYTNSATQVTTHSTTVTYLIQ